MTKDLDAHAWLRYVEKGLGAAELLLGLRFYRHALFWIEQASEKILKVYIMEVHRTKELTVHLGVGVWGVLWLFRALLSSSLQLCSDLLTAL